MPELYELSEQFLESSQTCQLFLEGLFSGQLSGLTSASFHTAGVENADSFLPVCPLRFHVPSRGVTRSHFINRSQDGSQDERTKRVCWLLTTICPLVCSPITHWDKSCLIRCSRPILSLTVPQTCWVTEEIATGKTGR